MRIKRINKGGECLGMVMKSDNERVQEEQEKESAREETGRVVSLGPALKHLHKGQGKVPSGGKGWHRASQTGRGGRPKRKIVEQENDREAVKRRRGDLVNSTSLVL